MGHVLSARRFHSILVRRCENDVDNAIVICMMSVLARTWNMVMAATDYYKALGVARSASAKEVKSAFRKLARQYHPDVNPGDADAERRFKEINEAHEVLGDAENRKKYDRHGENWMHSDRIEEMQRQGGFRSAGGMGFNGADGSSFRFESSGGFGGLGDILGQFFGGASRGGGSTQAWPNAEPQDVEVEITLQEAYHGARRSIRVPDGGGGTKTIEAQIPAGVDTGSRVRMSSAGPKTADGKNAPLHLKVTVKPDRQFSRKGADLTTEVAVPVLDALLGGEVMVGTISGSTVALRIPPETDNGKVFRISGKGMPKMRGTGTGDLLVKVSVTLPKNLQESERELLQQLRAMRETAGETQ